MYKKSVSWVTLFVVGLGLAGAGCSGEETGGAEAEEADSAAQDVRGKTLTNEAARPAVTAAAVVTDADRWKKLTVGGDFSCGIAIDDSLWCWGWNGNGQLGNGTKTDSNKPVKVLGSVTSWKDLKAGGRHVCAVDQTDSLYCWGSGGFGQLGQNNFLDSTTPVAVTGMSGNVASMSVGGGNTCAIVKNTGRLMCWGINTHSEIKNNVSLETTYILVPLEVDTNAWDSVAIGSSHICGQRSNKIYCSGHSFYGQLGIGATTSWDMTPMVQTGLSGNISNLSSFYYTTCAIRSNNVYCWGFNNYGQVGDGTQTNAMSPVQINIPSNKAVSSLSVGNGHNCALLSDSSLYCWGGNLYGQLAAPTPDIFSSTPQLAQFPASDPRVTSVYAGGIHTCALLGDQTARCWGLNARGQLGDGTNNNTATPVAVLTRGN